MTERESRVATPEIAYPSAESSVAAAQDLERVLEELTAADRQILLLRFGEELSNKEVAEIIGVPVFVAKMRVHRARKRFRDVYRQVTGDPQ